MRRGEENTFEKQRAERISNTLYNNERIITLY